MIKAEYNEENGVTNVDIVDNTHNLIRELSGVLENMYRVIADNAKENAPITPEDMLHTIVTDAVKKARKKLQVR